MPKGFKVGSAIKISIQTRPVTGLPCDWFVLWLPILGLVCPCNFGLPFDWLIWERIPGSAGWRHHWRTTRTRQRSAPVSDASRAEGAAVAAAGHALLPAAAVADGDPTPSVHVPEPSYAPDAPGRASPAPIVPCHMSNIEIKSKLVSAFHLLYWVFKSPLFAKQEHQSVVKPCNS